MDGSQLGEVLMVEGLFTGDPYVKNFRRTYKDMLTPSGALVLKAPLDVVK